MEVGIQYLLETPGGDITFNDGDGVLFLTNLRGIDQATIRNPYTNVPHSDGAILHTFRRGATFISFEGVIMAETRAAEDSAVTSLRQALDAIIYSGPGQYGYLISGGVTSWTKPSAGGLNDGILSWTPPGSTQRSMTVYLHEPLEVAGAGASAGGSPRGIAGPKGFNFVLVADRPHAWSY